MRIGILGTGTVGQKLGERWIRAGHEVGLGSRRADNPEALRWAEATGGAHGTFADVAAAAELVVNATAGQVSLAALDLAAPGLPGKVVLDVANALDFSHGFPPSLAVGPSESLAEQLQRAHPEVRLVKSLNTMPVEIMVAPESVAGGEHDAFVSGDDADAKALVVELLRNTGWRDERIRDLGGLATARGVELLLPLWLTLMQVSGSRLVTFRVVSG